MAEPPAAPLSSESGVVGVPGLARRGCKGSFEDDADGEDEFFARLFREAARRSSLATLRDSEVPRNSTVPVLSSGTLPACIDDTAWPEPPSRDPIPEAAAAAAARLLANRLRASRSSLSAASRSRLVLGPSSASSSTMSAPDAAPLAMASTYDATEAEWGRNEAIPLMGWA